MAKKPNDPRPRDERRAFEERLVTGHIVADPIDQHVVKDRLAHGGDIEPRVARRHALVAGVDSAQWVTAARDAPALLGAGSSTRWLAEHARANRPTTGSRSVADALSVAATG